MASQVQVAVDVEVVLVKVAGCSRLKRPNGNRHAIDGFGGGIGHRRRRKLTQDVAHGLGGGHAVQQRQAFRRRRKLLHRSRGQPDVRELVSAINEQSVLDERTANVRSSSVTVNPARSGQA